MASSLANKPDNFVGGKIHRAKSKWIAICKDQWVLDVLNGYILEFSETPVQTSLPPPLNLPALDQQALDKAMTHFIAQGVVESCALSRQGFVSNVFPTMKKDGTARVILNLSNLNLSVSYAHFKMDSVKDVIDLVQPNLFYDCRFQ